MITNSCHVFVFIQIQKFNFSFSSFCYLSLFHRSLKSFVFFLKCLRQHTPINNNNNNLFVLIHKSNSYSMQFIFQCVIHMQVLSIFLFLYRTYFSDLWLKHTLTAHNFFHVVNYYFFKNEDLLIKFD